jgi:beta-phosphoglucomutase-like phosphatase (HAD superfamily)
MPQRSVFLVAAGLGSINEEDGWIFKDVCSDGRFKPGAEGVEAVFSTGDGKVEVIAFADRSLAYVKSELGCPAYYPIHESALKKPVKAALMDLDGTTVRSEAFWVSIIEKTVRAVSGDAGFSFRAEDLPFVSGHSVSEHLSYCVGKYAPKASLASAREMYTRLAAAEMRGILEGKAVSSAFEPAPGVRSFLRLLKARGVKAALATSGLFEKAFPEIASAFESMGMGDPLAFYDSIVTAGTSLGKGRAGTLGELCAKPHPWLYSESGIVGLGIPFEERGHVIGVEDSGAGVCALRLAGYFTIGLAGGNIIESGARGMCNAYCGSFRI